MTDQVFDIHLELDPHLLAKHRNPTRAIAELARDQAEQFATDHGLVLRHPDPREVHVANGISRTTGRDVMLVATRWLAD